MRYLWIRRAAPLGLAVGLILAPASLHAGTDEADKPAVSDEAGAAAETILPADAEPFPARAAVRALIEIETVTTGLPPDIAEAVVFVESRYDSSIIGRLGEIGLMQVKPEIAAQLGFKGTTAELARPEVNIHYGVAYLAKAWRLAKGDLCRALMKYRAGPDEETMAARSTIYCNRTRNRLIAMNSPFAALGAIAAVTPDAAPASHPATAKRQTPRSPSRPTDVYAVYRRGTPAASRAFWAAHEARVRAIKARVEARRHRVASR